MSLRDDPGWDDWRWQMRHRIHAPETLEAWITPTEDERAAIEATRGIFRWNITPHYASLMDPHDPACPIRRQVVPTMAELAPDIVGVEDPLEEVSHSPVKNLIHNYPDRVAFCVTSECAIYCRYCLRKRMVGDSEMMMRRDELAEAIAYLREHAEIRDVLLTGGDPLTFSDRNLEWLLAELRAIPHLQLIRIGSRMPVKLPAAHHARAVRDAGAVPPALAQHALQPPEGALARERHRSGPPAPGGRAGGQPDRAAQGHQRRRRHAQGAL